MVSYLNHIHCSQHDYTATKAMGITLYTVPTQYSSVFSRSLHYYRPGLIYVTKKDVVAVNVFLILQEWFSTISLKRTNPDFVR